MPEPPIGTLLDRAIRAVLHEGLLSDWMLENGWLEMPKL
jgi:hypothetical protein